MKHTLAQPITVGEFIFEELEFSEPGVGAIEAFEAERFKEKAQRAAQAAKQLLDAGVPLSNLGDVLRALGEPPPGAKPEETDDGGFPALVVLLAACAKVPTDAIRALPVSDLAKIQDWLNPFLSAMTAGSGQAGGN